MRDLIKHLIGVLAGTWMLMLPGQGMAETWQHTWSVKTSAEYDSNPNMTPYNPESISRYLLEPSYRLRTTRGGEELDVGFALQIARSTNTAVSQNREDPSFFFGWRHRRETGEFGVTARYDEASTRTTKIDNLGLFLIENTRVNRAVSGNWSESLTERTTFAGDVGYQEVTYKKGTNNTGNFIDFSSRSTGLMLSYAWSERNTTFFKLSYADYEPKYSTSTSRLTTASAGWIWNASDNLEGTLVAGKSKRSNAETSTQGGLTLRYTGQQSGVELRADRQISPSGLGGFITVDQASASWSYALSERSKAGIDLGWYKNKSYFNSVTRTSGVWVNYNFNSGWGSQTYYRYRASDGGQGVAAFSNIVGVALVYNYSDF